ncbi:hypothetical protein ABZP36_034285 [Zizania latifolia]
MYGFDYDYTLSHYSEHLQCLIYDLAKKYLVNELKYPESCLQYEYDHSFPIRGLYYDRLKGCLLKLDFFGSIELDGCFFGRRKVGKLSNGDSLDLPSHDESAILSNDATIKDMEIMLADKQASLEKLEWEVKTSNKKVEDLQGDVSNMEFEIDSFVALFEKKLENISGDLHDGSLSSSFELEALQSAVSTHFEPFAFSD